MKVLALLSGGKDSHFAMMHCIANGHEIIALGSLIPPGSRSVVNIGKDDDPSSGNLGADGQAGDQTGQQRYTPSYCIP